MKMELCSRCKKRMAVVFVTRFDGEKTVNEGICLRCAKELGIKPVENMIEKMGLSDEDLDRMDTEMEELISGDGSDSDGTEMPGEDGEDTDGDGDDNGDNGHAPAVDFRKLFAPLADLSASLRPSESGENGADNGGENSGVRTEGGRREKRGKKRKYLTLYCTDLTEKAREGKLDRVIGRDREIARTVQILCRRQKNNPCLIGEPGVGKTAVAEAVAQMIASPDVPWKLRGKEVFQLDLTALVAGTQFRGQFESRMKGLIDEIKACGNIVLVIDEVHMIAESGNAEGGMNAANILKPALSKGEIQIIGATTLTEYRKYIEKDSALERRFQPIILEEPSVEASIEILRGIKGYYESFHGIKIPDYTVQRAVTLSERYITDRFLPDKAIDLLDEASSHLALASPVIKETEELAAELASVRSEREALESESGGEGPADEQRYARIAELRTREIGMQERFDRLSAERDAISLSVSDLADVVEIWTGIPASTITEHEFARIDTLGDRLRAHIIGQDEAVDAVVRAIKRNRAGVSAKRKPVSFIFAGSTGVGKTELVKRLAEDLFNSPETLIRLDMSEFMEKHSVSRIIGSPPGYVGYDDAGQLTEKIRRKPYSVILFDEIEKAHPDVLNILLQILDEGRVSDAHGKVVSFENTVIIMTTNAGATMSSNTPGFGASAQKQEKGRTEKALGEFLRPEFINRVDEIITFRSLGREDFVRIAGLMLGELRDTLAARDIKVSWTEAAQEYVADRSYSRKFGARNMRRYVQTHIEDGIADELIRRYGERVTAVTIDAPGEGAEPDAYPVITVISDKDGLQKSDV